MKNRHYLLPNLFTTLKIIINKDFPTPENLFVTTVETVNTLLEIAEPNKKAIEETLLTETSLEKTPDQTTTLITDLIPDTEANLEITTDSTIIAATNMIDPEVTSNLEIDIDQTINTSILLTSPTDPKIDL